MSNRDSSAVNNGGHLLDLCINPSSACACVTPLQYFWLYYSILTFILCDYLQGSSPLGEKCLSHILTCLSHFCKIYKHNILVTSDCAFIDRVHLYWGLPPVVFLLLPKKIPVCNSDQLSFSCYRLCLPLTAFLLFATSPVLVPRTTLFRINMLPLLPMLALQSVRLLTSVVQTPCLISLVVLFRRPIPSVSRPRLQQIIKLSQLVSVALAVVEMRTCLNLVSRNLYSWLLLFKNSSPLTRMARLTTLALVTTLLWVLF